MGSATRRYAGTARVLGSDVEVAVQVEHVPITVATAIRGRVEVGQGGAITLEKLYFSGYIRPLFPATPNIHIVARFRDTVAYGAVRAIQLDGEGFRRAVGGTSAV